MNDIPNKAKALAFHRHRRSNNPSLRWLIKGLIPETGTGLLSGTSGAYKSFIAFDISGAIASAPVFLGFKVKRSGASLIFASEGKANIDARIDALSVAKYDDRPLPIYVSTAPVSLLDPDSVADVIETARQVSIGVEREDNLPLSLLVFDTLAGCAGYLKTGDENDPTINHRLFSILNDISRTTGAFVLAVDHFGKNPETGTRGASSKEAAADTVLVALGDKSISGNVTNLRLGVRKQRDGVSGIEFPYAVRVIETGTDEDGESITSLVIEFGDPATATKPKDKESSSAGVRTLRRVMMAMLTDCGENITPFADGPTVRAVRQNLVRAEFYRQYPTGEADQEHKAEARKKAFKRAIANKAFVSREIEGTDWLWLSTE